MHGEMNFSEKKGEEVPLGRPKCSCEGSIKMDLKEVGYEGLDCIHLGPG